MDSSQIGRAACLTMIMLSGAPTIAVAADCADPAVISLSYEKVRSTVAGELVTYTFDLVAVLQNEGSKDYVGTIGAQSFDLSADDSPPFATMDFPKLLAGSSIELRGKVTNWSPLDGPLKFTARTRPQPLADDCHPDNNEVGITGVELEEELRGK
jgi:hypothetical protein